MKKVTIVLITCITLVVITLASAAGVYAYQKQQEPIILAKQNAALVQDYSKVESMKMSMAVHVQSVKADIVVNGRKTNLDIPSSGLDQIVNVNVDVKNGNVEYLDGPLKGTKLSVDEFKKANYNFSDKDSITNLLNQKKFKQETTIVEGAEMLKITFDDPALTNSVNEGLHRFMQSTSSNSLSTSDTQVTLENLSINNKSNVVLSYFIDKKTHILKSFDMNLPGDIDTAMTMHMSSPRSTGESLKADMHMSIKGMDVSVVIKEIKMVPGYSIDRGFMVEVVDRIFKL